MFPLPALHHIRVQSEISEPRHYRFVIVRERNECPLGISPRWQRWCAIPFFLSYISAWLLITDALISVDGEVPDVLTGFPPDLLHFDHAFFRRLQTRTV